MDISVSIGVLSIAVSILVGLGTFYVADRRARRNRWQQAKDTVLRELSKSLGEGNIPSREIISATIRSVLRGYNASDLNAVSVDEVVDDLIRQITSDPFLDADRRKQLQREVLVAKLEKVEGIETAPAEKVTVGVEIAGAKIETRLASWSTLISFLAAVVTSIIAGISFLSLERVFDWVKVHAEQGLMIIAPILGAIITLILSILWKTLASERSKKKK